MEEWFHDANDKNEVGCAREEIAKVLKSLQRFFPRKDNTNGYNLPKMHGNDENAAVYDTVWKWH